ncbi:hypothetical protein OC842_007169 [Tilletia horrida]|uniref:PITH domain-containing protein n=1 Tax=Tilletia horrida TaxID=155126 RepID=A0AAN6G6T3_9BASI|nr:hypothetical protein OC842_007169 [Tilletia horrida]
MNCNEEVTTVDLNQVGLQAGDESNLYEHIDRDKVWGLNLAVPEAAAGVIKPWHERNSLEVYVESLVDDQFIITVPLTCPCRIKSILLNPGRGDLAPQRCRAYVNRPQGISFDEVEANSSAEAPAVPTPPPPRPAPSAAVPTQGLSNLRLSAPSSAPSSASSAQAGEERGGSAQQQQQQQQQQQHYVSSTSATNRAGAVGSVGSGKPQADFALLEGGIGGGVSEYPVSLARFANVNSVSIVLSDAPGLETGQLFYLGFRGTALSLKKSEQADFDVPAANAADAPIDGVRDRAQGGSIRQGGVR